MPARPKRSNWRQPNTYDDGEAYTSSGRRTTRVSRGQKQQAQSSSSRSSRAAARRDKDGAVINVSRSKAPAKTWVQVSRPPAPGIRFAVPVWITAEELTPEERAHLPADVQQRLSSSGEPGTDADSPDAKRQRTETPVNASTAETATAAATPAAAVVDTTTTTTISTTATIPAVEPMITSPVAATTAVPTPTEEGKTESQQPIVPQPTVMNDVSTASDNNPLSQPAPSATEAVEGTETPADTSTIST